MASEQLPPPPVPRPAVPYSRPVTTGATVTVACKLPSGLILRCFSEEMIEEPQQGGGTKPVRRSRPIPGKQFILRGTWTGSAGQAYAKNNPAVAELLPGGYCLTHGVPKEVWDHWYAQNKDTQLVQKRVVFAVPSLTGATEEAKKGRDVKSGLEPLDADKPASRMPGGVDRRVRMDVLTHDEGTSPR